MAAKSKRKVEKLRKQLEREEKRIAKAEAKASKYKLEPYTKVGRTDTSALGDENKKRKRSNSGESGNSKTEDTNLGKPKLQEAVSTMPDPLTPTSQPALADEEQDPPPKALNADGTLGQVNSSTGEEGEGPSLTDVELSMQDSSALISDSSSDTSADPEDITSSSGPSSEDDSDDEAPDEASTKRNGPARVAPPKRAKPKQICREFLHRGLCKRGSRCKYLHELPDRGSHGVGSQEIKGAEGKKERVGLYQRVSRHSHIRW